MSQVKVSGNASGTGIFEIAAPNSNSNYTLTLPTASTTLVGTDATQTLTNKTYSNPTFSGTASGTVLVSGTAVPYTSATNGGTTIDFTGIPSWVKRITVMFKGVSTSSTASIIVQLGTGAGPTFTTTGYVAGSSTTSGTNTTGTTGFFAVNSVGASEVYSGPVTLFNFSGTDWVSSNTVCNTGTGNTRCGGGYLALGATLTAVRITTTSTDTFDAGSINILYE